MRIAQYVGCGASRGQCSVFNDPKDILILIPVVPFAASGMNRLCRLLGEHLSRLPQIGNEIAVFPRLVRFVFDAQQK
jgi:hypothetical protein